jgi:hypothetical protein
MGEISKYFFRGIVGGTIIIPSFKIAVLLLCDCSRTEWHVITLQDSFSSSKKGLNLAEKYIGRHSEQRLCVEESFMLLVL